MNGRIVGTDTIQSAIIKLTEGNPGAFHVCVELIKQAGAIDPDDLLGGLSKLLSLDGLGIYGPRIWMLYKDVCDCDMVSTTCVLRGWQLGLIDRRQLDYAIDNRGDGLDVADVLANVRQKLPAFAAQRPKTSLA